MRRRTVLGLVGSLVTSVLAGCSGQTYSDWLWMRPADSERIVKLRTPTVDTRARRRFVQAVIRNDGLNSTDPAWDAVPKPDYYYFLDEPTYYNGTVYNFTAQGGGTIEYDFYLVALERQNGASETDTGTVVNFSNLPSVDRRAFAPGLYTEDSATGTPRPRPPPAFLSGGRGFAPGIEQT